MSRLRNLNLLLTLCTCPCSLSSERRLPALALLTMSCLLVLVVPLMLVNTAYAKKMSGTWRATGSMAVARVYQTATMLPNGNVLVAGGCCSTHRSRGRVSNSNLHLAHLATNPQSSCFLGVGRGMFNGHALRPILAVSDSIAYMKCFCATMQ
jgi:hypothetical protein